jgi:hypothetical protein
MRPRFAFILTLVLLLGSPLSSTAQPAGRVSVTGAVEYASITEDDGFLGAGIGGAAGMAIHLTDATSLELEAGWERHARDLGFYAVAFDAQGRPEAFPFTERQKGMATFVLGLVSHSFGSRIVRPVVWSGGGLMHYGGTTAEALTRPAIPPGFTLPSGDAERLAGTRRGPGVNALVFDAGAGAKIRVTDGITATPFAGLRLAGAGNAGPKYIVRMGARLAYRW